jgi:hypothetical protein
MFTKWSSSQKVSKFMPKKFYKSNPTKGDAKERGQTHNLVMIKH